MQYGMVVFDQDDEMKKCEKKWKKNSQKEYKKESI